MNAPPFSASLRDQRLALLRRHERETRDHILRLFPQEKIAVRKWRDSLPVALVLSGPRGGTSAFKAALARHPDCLALSGEHRIFFTIKGYNHPDGSSEDEAADVALTDAERTELLEMIFVSAFAGPETASPTYEEAVRYAWDWAYRLPMQWTGLDIDAGKVVPVVLAAVEQFRSGATGDLETLDSIVLDALAAAFPGLDRRYYDLPGGSRSVGGWQSARTAGFQPIVEITPFVIPRPRSLKTPEHSPKLLLLKASSDPFRLKTLRSLFAGRQVRILRLTRNPLASVNGLIDGWQHHCFWQHDLGADLGIDHPYASWCFDLFPGWRDQAPALDLPALCARQWIEPNRRVERAAESPAANESWATFAFEDFMRSPETRSRLLADASAFIGLAEDEAIVTAAKRPPRVNVTVPHAAARWRKRSGRLLPLLDDRDLSEIAERLGYRREGLDDWI